MFSWGESIFTISNEQDHEAQHTAPKQVGTLTLSSPGRYTINLSRMPVQQSHQHVLQMVLEELGLEEEQF
jgi:predicted  nucleic acid-binding Zn-ribbon protein